MPGIFKNDNEEAYVGGKKHWLDILKNSAPADTWVWRLPEEDFNDNSKLIVMPGEKAVFIKGGQIAGEFGPGTYALDSDNYPFLSRLKNMFSGGISGYNSVVYFYRTTPSAEMKWGFGGITAHDVVNDFMVTFGAHGYYQLQITDPITVLSNLIGNEVYGLNEQEFNKRFATKVKSSISVEVAKFVSSFEQDLRYLNNYKDLFSESLSVVMNTILKDSGLCCSSIAIEEFVVQDDGRYQLIENDKFNDKRERTEAERQHVRDMLSSQYSREESEYAQETENRLGKIKAQGQGEIRGVERNTELLDEQAEQQKEIMRAQAEAERVRLLKAAEGMGTAEAIKAMGQDVYIKERALDVLQTLAANPGAGSSASDAMGMGMGLGVMSGTAQFASSLVGSVFGNPSMQPASQSFAADFQQASEADEFQTASELSSSSHITEEKSVKPTEPIIDKNYIASKMAEMKELLDMGLYTQEEYEADRKALLAEYRKRSHI